MAVYLCMSSGLNFNYEREVEQLRIAIDYHQRKAAEIDEYIEKLEEARAPGTGKTEQSYQVIKLAQKKQIHIDRICEIVSRIHELNNETEDEEHVVECGKEECQSTSVQYEDLLRDDIEYCPYHQDEEQDEEDDEYLDDIFSDDKIPPEFHLDHLESHLDYNLGQVDGFTELAWKSKCKLARLAVDHDLSLEEAETVLDLNQGDNARGVSC